VDAHNFCGRLNEMLCDSDNQKIMNENLKSLNKLSFCSSELYIIEKSNKSKVFFIILFISKLIND
jgi:hypothetical protein